MSFFTLIQKRVFEFFFKIGIVLCMLACWDMLCNKYIKWIFQFFFNFRNGEMTFSLDSKTRFSIFFKIGIFLCILAHPGALGYVAQQMVSNGVFNFFSILVMGKCHFSLWFKNVFLNFFQNWYLFVYILPGWDIL